MKRKSLDILFFTVAAVVAAAFTFGELHMPGRERTYGADGRFSSDRVISHIDSISLEPHSIEHPAARKRVRDYLVKELESYGGDVRMYSYDSVPNSVTGHADLHNIFAVFEPDSVPAASYVLLMAHYDSRYALDVKGRTVYSFGAADDGYGLSVALELVRNAVSRRHLWKQGVKVLFTDAEEVRTAGMKEQCANDPEVFDNVAVAFNIEARGVKGPVLLFEVSGGNSALVDFYGRNARYKYAYSLSSVLYAMLPNYTDFTLVKDSIPGYNLAVMDNLSYYHTDLDCRDNISVKSINHYGAVIEPMVREFLEGGYHDADCFRSDSDKVFFTVPLLGMFSFGKYAWASFNVLYVVLLALVAVLYRYEWMLSFRAVARELLRFLLFCIVSSAAVTAMVYAYTELSGLEFSFTGTKYLYAEKTVTASLIALAVIVYVMVSGVKSERERFMAVSFLAAVCSLAGYFAIGENFFISLPLTVSLGALVADRFIKSSLWYLAAFFVTLLVSVSFYRILFVSMTVGILGPSFMVMSINMALTVSLLRFVFQIRK